ncbi:hypothetical protein B0H13DRAFT_2564869 [Mycena leptocephala]|nr:hypothetical protein B0H13DRAFT_2564869 [Mycena leptocephala]
MFSAGMFFCMALNLQLTLVQTVNGQKMEKYYIFGTLLVCAACNITPWNVVNETCWFQTPDQTVMLRWLIGTQLFWVLLMSTGEIVAFLVIIGYFISYEVRRLSIVSKPSPTFTFEARHTALCPQSEDSMAGYLEYSTPSDSPISLYRNIILRIGAGTNWRLSIANLVICSMRPLVYSVLASQIPRSSVRSWQYGPVETTRPIEQSVGFQFTVPTGTNVVHIELQAVDQSGHKQNSADLDWCRGTYPVESNPKPLPPKRSLSGQMGSITSVALQI